MSTRGVDVGGRRLWATWSVHEPAGASRAHEQPDAPECAALDHTRRPVVILETGLGAESDEWAPVQQMLSVRACVFRYDRAGRGKSDPAPRPRTAMQMVDDLKKLLDVAGLPGPYVLVGHSFGGLLMRLFAHRYRSDVVGLVLVDAMHEDQFDVFGPAFPPEHADDAPALRETRRFWTTGWRDATSTREGIDFVASCMQARRVTSLGDLPLQVMTAGTFLNQPGVPPAARDRLQRMWAQLQQRFCLLSSDVVSSSLPGCGHFLQREAPAQVSAAIDDMLARVVGRDRCLRL